MNRSRGSTSRRTALARCAGLAAGWVALTVLPSRALAALARTPSQSEGPYYPPDPPASAGNDLIHLDGQRAEGRPLALSGRVVTSSGQPLAGAAVEIWQCDARRVYRHPRAPNRAAADPAFAGFGRAVTDDAGRYRFVTIVPVAYPGRPPHVHAKIRVADTERLTTQLYLEGHPDNARDGLLARLLGGSRERLMIAPRAARLAEGIEGSAAEFEFVV